VAEKMSYDSHKVNDKFKFLENMANLKEKDSRLLFWFFALLTIPVFGYLYTLPFSFILRSISELFRLNDELIDTLDKLVVAASFIFAIGTQFYLWKLFKNKRSPNNNSIT